MTNITMRATGLPSSLCCSSFGGVAPTLFHWFWSIAQQALNQEARGGNLFNDDEEDIERYIDDDDDDFVDNVRFQDEQVDPSAI